MIDYKFITSNNESNITLEAKAWTYRQESPNQIAQSSNPRRDRVIKNGNGALGNQRQKEATKHLATKSTTARALGNRWREGMTTKGMRTARESSNWIDGNTSTEQSATRGNDDNQHKAWEWRREDWVEFQTSNKKLRLGREWREGELEKKEQRSMKYLFAS